MYGTCQTDTQNLYSMNVTVCHKGWVSWGDIMKQKGPERSPWNTGCPGKSGTFLRQFMNSGNEIWCWLKPAKSSFKTLRCGKYLGHGRVAVGALKGLTFTDVQVELWKRFGITMLSALLPLHWKNSFPSNIWPQNHRIQKRFFLFFSPKCFFGVMVLIKVTPT